MKKTQQINVGLIRCLCCNCGNDYSFARLSDFSYGEWLLCTEDGKVRAYVNCIEDLVVNEAGEIVKFLLRNVGLSEAQSIQRFHQVFDFTCDLINGAVVVMEERTDCPRCGNDKPKMSEYTPPRTAKIECATVTHEKWLSLSPDMRRQKLKEEMSRRGLI